MTNRYRSSCCCSETENQSVCFTGFGAVPKTAYLPNGCHSSFSKLSGQFNRHDNWSFCVHDKEEELVCVIDRTGFKSVAELAYAGDNNACRCECLTEVESTAGINYASLEKPPIVVWYKHPYPTGRVSDVPASHIDELYYWRSYWKEDLRITPKILRSDTWPCGCPDHKFSSGVGCRSDFFCLDGFFSYCGYDVNDEQLTWWRDNDGNIRYLTQSEIEFIGHPDGTGTNAGWRTSRWGYVPGGPTRDGNSCEITDDGFRLGFGLIEGNTREQKNGDYLYLQDIVSQGSPTSTNGKPRLFKNYRLNISLTSISVVRDYGWGSCEEYPYGLYPLSFTFWGVMHREKWWQQYWNSISENDVCPSGDCELGVESDIHTGQFAERCRVPQYIIEQCAGVPLFTHELVDKLDTDDIKNEIGTLPLLNVPYGEDVLEIEAITPAAYVMAAIMFQNGIVPKVTEIMEREGILPPPINYGEEQDYRIFQKTFKAHDLEGSDGSSTEEGRCCINVNSGSWEGPLYCDCAQTGAAACGFTGTREESISRGITSCWYPEYYTDTNSNGISDGVECSRFVCGDIQGDNYNEFLQRLVDEGLYGSVDLARESLIGCCDTAWDNECVLSARVATEYGYCGPPSLCVDTNKNLCRNYFGSQHFAGSPTCLESTQDPNQETCRDKFDQIGSCCLTQVGGLGGDQDPIIVHCLEISKDLCESFPQSIDDKDAWIQAVSNAYQNGTVGGVSPSQLNEIFGGEDVNVPRCNTVSGTCIPSYTGLRNCEPVCDTDAKQQLNRNAFACTNEYIPCDDQEECPQIGFDEFTYYFYGRPGGWRHICSGSISMLPGEESNDPELTNLDSGYWGQFFPQSGSEYNGSDYCPQDGCWTAAPYPTEYSSDPVPSGINYCPQLIDGQCPTEPQPASDGVNCGEPLLSVCGSGLDATPNYPVDPNDVRTIFWPGSDANYQSINPFCYNEAYSHTCFGVWFQHKRTSLLWAGDDNGDCAKKTDYYCSNVNNAFWLRVPGKTRNDSFCKDYDVKYNTHVAGENDGGGSDDTEWEGSAVNGPAVLVYHNRVLDDFIQFYGGCVHEITQGDSDADLNRLVNCGSGSLIMQWDIFQGNPSGEYSLYVGDAATDKVWIERNNGDPSSSSNPYKITIHVEDGIGTDPPDLWWGIVLYDPSNIGLPVPISSIITTEGCNISNPTSLWPTTVAQNKIYVKTKDQNPGDYPNGLRDYSWYHAPITREQPLPSAFQINPDGRDCWTGTPCCNTKLTQEYYQSGIICDHWSSDFIQGQPGGESECNYDKLPSNGENLPDPMCGACPPGTYCCPYLTEPRCIPDGTYCCSNCQPGEICVSIDGTLTCVPE